MMFLYYATERRLCNSQLVLHSLSSNAGSIILRPPKCVGRAKRLLIRLPVGGRLVIAGMNLKSLVFLKGSIN